MPGRCLFLLRLIFLSGFDGVVGAFVGVEAEGGEVLFVGGGEVFEVVDGAEGAVDEEGGGAEVEGVACLGGVLFESSDEDELW